MYDKAILYSSPTKLHVPQNAPSALFWGGQQRWDASSLSLTASALVWHGRTLPKAAPRRQVGDVMWPEVTPALETGASTNNRISTSGTCKFARDGPGPPYAIRFAFGMLPLLIYETILCFPILWKVIQNYGNGYGSSFFSGMVHDSIFTVLCLDSTIYCAPGACSSYRWLIKGK
ncbi:hypothetical protein BU17DRAFT_60043 [Hysterangium stoloniferum]|nr:hypothetical protein BU17DRAFT_60043 [Hysterangium stoloniferum]